MLFVFILIVAVVLLVLVVSNAYTIWYAKTGRYELDNRLDNVTKR